ncbi:probable mediator of RNA polymerase II transcription subunit 26b isoform X2 [Brachypodium distachyon]|uniref:TFIIS N-terminal domain-containing protein n=1 Tax=Brachypodium distachyon TaxID=15368 RepID=A0A2K2DK51_BRADI|nr:probable mediator of RNA polymerase II transcription subunit 26b isoform X2 [Brachypodium distachyon]PNT74658.1 hypothetical protein BRADI_1g19810v3 [Brachypodium distachyon]|eukprot:XP_024313393.1 probable mediator of RNA polymerase II transcription subunit 26b isoform X2 [Brachypodium distachyon]
MAPPPSTDCWAAFFRAAGDGIFDLIEAAIDVAAADRPDALRARRDAIAEHLYTATLAVSGAPAAAAGAAARPPAPVPAVEPRTEALQQKQQQLLLPEGAASVPSLCSSDRAEAITDDGAPRRGEGDDAVAAEAERIKAALVNYHEKSEGALLELLRRLQQLEFTVHTLKVTEIGKTVTNLRKHNSKQIRQLVRLLVGGWKLIVDDWMSSGGDAIVDHTPQSMHPSNLEQEDRGLSSPAMDEGALLATLSTSIGLSEDNQNSRLFHGIDDGNTRNSGQRNLGCQEPIRRPPLPMAQQYDPDQSWRQEQSAARQSRPQELTNGQTKEQFIAAMLARPPASNAKPGPVRPQVRSKPHQDASPAQGRPQSVPSDVGNYDANSVRAKLGLAKNAKLEMSNNSKLEVAKRKLQEGYQEFDNAKKQKCIQMVDPQDVRKQGNRSGQPSGKPWNSSNTNNNRNWSSR